MDEFKSKDMTDIMALLMGELLQNEPQKKPVIETQNRLGKTVVIVPPFSVEDDLDYEFILEIWNKVLDHYIHRAEYIKLGCRLEDMEFLKETKKQFDQCEEYRNEIMVFAEGRINEKIIQSLKSKPLTIDNKVIWKEIFLSHGKIKTELKNIGAEYVIHDLDEEDILFIDRITNEFFHISYF